jgi:hypothetical protein
MMGRHLQQRAAEPAAPMRRIDRQFLDVEMPGQRTRDDEADRRVAIVSGDPDLLPVEQRGEKGDIRNRIVADLGMAVMAEEFSRAVLDADQRDIVLRPARTDRIAGRKRAQRYTPSTRTISPSAYFWRIEAAWAYSGEW